MTPFVTVLITAYNSEKYISESISSILNQNYSNYEILIIDDGSTDRTTNKIREFDDTRIRLIENKENKGILFSANLGLENARGKYISRLDSDDLALPTRLKKQVEFLENNPEYGICGTYAKTFEGRQELWIVPSNHDEIRANLLFYNTFINSSIMIRKKVLHEHNLKYRYPLAEDYDLFIRVSNLYKAHNLNEVLTLYRIHNSQISQNKITELNNIAVNLRIEQLKKDFISLNNENINIFKNFISHQYQGNIYQLIGTFENILSENRLHNYYNHETLKRVIFLKLKNHIRTKGYSHLKTTAYNKLFSTKSVIKVMGFKWAIKLLAFA